MNAKWSSLDRLTADYKALSGGAEGFATGELYVTVACHAAMDGSSLTVGEASQLFDLGVAVGGRPLADYLAVADLKEAYAMADRAIGDGAAITPGLLCRLNAAASARTGRERIGAGGIWDERKGEYSKEGKTDDDMHGHGETAAFVDTLCAQLNEALSHPMSPEERYDLSFRAAYNLSSISPWSSRTNGTALIAMYMVQRAGGLVPTAIAPDLKDEYLKSLAFSKQYRNMAPFVNFMKTAHLRYLKDMPAVPLCAERKIYLADAEKADVPEPEESRLEGLFAFMPEEPADAMIVEDDALPADLPVAVDLDEIEF